MLNGRDETMNNPDNGRPILTINRKPKKTLSVSSKKEAEPAKPVTAVRKKRKSASFRRWQKKRHQRYRKRTCLPELIRLWPALFDTCNVRPLITGVHALLLEDWLARFPEGKSREERLTFLRQALGYYTHRPAYLKALTYADAQRHKLDGTAVEKVSTAHQHLAKCRLLTGLLNHPEKSGMLCDVIETGKEEITIHYFSSMNQQDLNALHLRFINLF